MDAPIDCLPVKRQNQKKAKPKKRLTRNDFERLIYKGSEDKIGKK